MLGERIDKHNVIVWLVNTGWTGGPVGVGHRMQIAYTRAMVNAAVNGQLNAVATELDPIFGVAIPTYVPDVAPEVLRPRDTWEDKQAYDEKARDLAARFKENFVQFRDQVDPAVQTAGPRVEKPAPLE